MNSSPKPFKRILVPLEHSRIAPSLLRLAQSLASGHKTEILLLSVVEPMILWDMDPSYPNMSEKFLGEQIKKVKSYLEHLARGLKVKHRIMVKTGNPILEILRTARSQKVDLILIGSHSKKGLQRVLLGSVAEGVARKARQPTWIVRRASHKISKMMVPMDGSPGSLKALEFANRVALLTQGDIYPETVVDDRVASVFMPEATELLPTMIQSRERAFLRWLKKIPGARIKQSFVDEGTPKKVILERAKKLKPDLIVVGSHSQKGIMYTLLGRVSTYLIKNAPCSVVVVHSAERRFRLI